LFDTAKDGNIGHTTMHKSAHFRAFFTKVYNVNLQALEVGMLRNKRFRYKHTA